jgi:hypothetical protein
MSPLDPSNALVVATAGSDSIHGARTLHYPRLIRSTQRQPVENVPMLCTNSSCIKHAQNAFQPLAIERMPDYKDQMCGNRVSPRLETNLPLVSCFPCGVDVEATLQGPEGPSGCCEGGQSWRRPLRFPYGARSRANESSRHHQNRQRGVLVYPMDTSNLGRAQHDQAPQAFPSDSWCDDPNHNVPPNPKSPRELLPCQLDAQRRRQMGLLRRFLQWLRHREATAVHTCMHAEFAEVWTYLKGMESSIVQQAVDRLSTIDTNAAQPLSVIPSTVPPETFHPMNHGANVRQSADVSGTIADSVSEDDDASDRSSNIDSNNTAAIGRKSLIFLLGVETPISTCTRIRRTGTAC